MNKFRLYFQATAIGFVLLFAGVLALPLNNVEAKYPPNFIPCDHDISNQPVHITVGTDPTFDNVYRLSWYLYNRNNHLIRYSETYNFHMGTTHETIEYYESNDDKCVAKISAHITTLSGYQTGATWAIPRQGGEDENKLVDVLNVLPDADINLSHIDKRPSGRTNWEYTFFIDCDAHQQASAMDEAIDQARSHCVSLKLLGSYPRAQRIL